MVLLSEKKKELDPQTHIYLESVSPQNIISMATHNPFSIQKAKKC